MAGLWEPSIGSMQYKARFSRPYFVRQRLKQGSQDTAYPSLMNPNVRAGVTLPLLLSEHLFVIVCILCNLQADKDKARILGNRSFFIIGFIIVSLPVLLFIFFSLFLFVSLPSFFFLFLSPSPQYFSKSEKVFCWTHTKP